jgi:ketosteroid isomerase-like protein
MSDALRQQIHKFYAAYAAGKIDAVLEAFDENVDFVSFAPRELFPVLGRRHGRAEVATTMKVMHAAFEFVAYQPFFIVVSDEKEAATMVLARLKQRSTGRFIQLYIANFMRFRDGRVTEFREFMDTFDAAQQILGREIDLSKV